MSSPSSSTPRSSVSSQAPELTLSNRDIKTTLPSTWNKGQSAHINNHNGGLGVANYHVSGIQREMESNRPRRKRRQPGSFLLKAVASTSRPTVDYASPVRGHNITSENVQNTERPSGGTQPSSAGAQRASTVAKSPLSREVPLFSYKSHIDKTENTEKDELHPIIDERSVTDGWHSGPGKLDNTPAHIVNLALNLSETRRRHLGTGRLPSLEAVPNRRNTPTPQLVSGVSATTSAGGLSNISSQQRRISRTQPPNPDSGVSYRKPTLLGSPFVAGTLNGQLLEDFASGNLVDPSFNPSDATIIRAERAKLILELAYEHRRLLQYLPTLPQCPECKPVSSRLATNNSLGTSTSLGRVFNPLQYIRNRKVRLRERRTLDSEADGWKDVENVRAWVDLVAEARKDHKSKIHDEYPLPEFSGRMEIADRRLPDPLSTGMTALSPQTKKATRPRTDWITTPWDLLGDHYWLYQSENIFLIEDRHRHKLYIGKSSSVPARPFSRRSGSISRFTKASDRGVTSKDPKQEDPHERGRPKHQRFDSFQSQHEYNSSRERKNRWPRKFIRSNSSSSSEDTDIELKARRWGQNARTLKDNRLLDRQIMMLMSQETSHWRWKDVHDFDEGNTTDARSARLSSPDSINSSLSGLGEKRPVSDSVENQDPRNSNQLSLDSRKASFSIEAIGNDKTEVVDEFHQLPKKTVKRKQLVNEKESFDNSLPILSSKDKGSERVQRLDFASNSPDSKQKPRQENSIDPRSSNGNNLLLSSTAENNVRSRKHRPLIKRSKTLGVQSGPEFRLKGLLRGARLSDIVASPVNKVGELIWRKDTAEHVGFGSLTSTTSSESSETDHGIDRIEPELSRSATEISNQSASEKTRYHIDNLPVFKSPFARDNELARTNEPDHISRQQSAFREMRSERFEKLAPPTLDLRSISRSPSPPELDKNSTSVPQSPVPESGTAERRRFAVVEGPPDLQGRRHPVTGNSPGLSIGHHVDENGLLKLRIGPSEGTITYADIARSRALIRSTNIKANNILWTATSVRSPPHPVLQSLQGSSIAPMEPVPRAQEFIIMGGLLVKSIDEKNAALRAATNSFTNTTMAELHDRLKRLDEFITNTLTGMVRKAADDADDLGAKLAADCTMEVKRLNENIDLVLRRRRRRMRWLRRGGYLVLEWALLTLMWCVWLLVVLFQMIRGTVRGVIKCIKWLLWLH